MRSMANAKSKRAEPTAVAARTSHALVGTWEDPEKRFMVAVRYNNPLAGVWQEEKNSVSETSVIYKIEVEDERFVVSAVDESDGTAFKITHVRWDGECLKFSTLFPPTGHRARHVLHVLKAGLMKHEITYTETEIWKKRKPARRS
jgi:hypothetical protein